MRASLKSLTQVSASLAVITLLFCSGMVDERQGNYGGSSTGNFERKSVKPSSPIETPSECMYSIPSPVFSGRLQ